MTPRITLTDNPLRIKYEVDQLLKRLGSTQLRPHEIEHAGLDLPRFAAWEYVPSPTASGVAAQ